MFFFFNKVIILSIYCVFSDTVRGLTLCVAFHVTWCTCDWVILQPGGGGSRKRVKVVKANRPHMVLRNWNFWHMSRMLTQSNERLSTGTDLTDSARLLTRREALMDIRTKIALLSSSAWRNCLEFKILPVYSASRQLSVRWLASQCGSI